MALTVDNLLQATCLAAVPLRGGAAIAYPLLGKVHPIVLVAPPVPAYGGGADSLSDASDLDGGQQVLPCSAADSLSRGGQLHWRQRFRPTGSQVPREWSPHGDAGAQEADLLSVLCVAHGSHSMGSCSSGPGFWGFLVVLVENYFRQQQHQS